MLTGGQDDEGGEGELPDGQIPGILLVLRWVNAVFKTMVDQAKHPD